VLSKIELKFTIVSDFQMLLAEKAIKRTKMKKLIQIETELHACSTGRMHHKQNQNFHMAVPTVLAQGQWDKNLFHLKAGNLWE
jgi:hypothetical protein